MLLFGAHLQLFLSLRPPPLFLFWSKRSSALEILQQGDAPILNVIEAKASGDSTRVLYATIPPLLETSNGPPSLYFDCSGAKSDQTAF